MSNEISFSIPGVPVPWSRAAGGKTRKHFTPAKQRSYMKLVQIYAKIAMQGKPPLTGAIELNLFAIYPTPKKAKIEWKTTRPDLDNLQKIVMDSLNGILWNDDAQVCSMWSSKMYGINPYVGVVAKQLTVV